MMKYQYIQHPTCPRAGNVKREILCSSPKLNVFYPKQSDVHSMFRDVQVSFMNRLYQGIGLRNNNGGLEFISDEYKEIRCSSVRDYLKTLRDELQSMEDEYKVVEYENLRDKGSIENWKKKIEVLQQQLEDCGVSLNLFLTQCKSGQYEKKEKMRIRQHLSSEKRRIKREIDLLQKALDGYDRNKSRLLLLRYILPELREKILNKEKELDIVNIFTVQQAGLLTFPWKKGYVSNQVNLFLDIFDYLSYVFLVKHYGIKDFPVFCDSIVLNDPRNFVNMTLDSEVYDRIYCYFPHTLIGKMMEKTLSEKISSRRVISMASYYENHVTLYEYAKTFKDFAPIKNKN